MTGSKFYLQADGKLGIGTTTPSSKLDVQTSDEQFAIYGTNTRNTGTSDNYGVYGKAEANGGTPYGVYGEARSNTTANRRANGVTGAAYANDSGGTQADATGGTFFAFAADQAYGVNAQATTDTGIAYGIRAQGSTFNNTGTTTYGVYATTTGTVPTERYGQMLWIWV